MKRSRLYKLIAVAGVGFAIASGAQEAAPDKTAQIEAKMRMAEDRAAREEAKIEDLVDQMLMLDGEIEHAVQEAVKLTASLRDSRDSKLRVTDLKEDAVEGLAKILKLYQREREKRLRALKQPYSAVPKTELLQDVSVLDEKIEKRIDQILAVTKSLDQHKDMQRYRTTYRGTTYDLERSRTASHNRKTSSRGVQTKEQVVEGLKKSIKDLRGEITRMERMLPATKEDAARDVLKNKIAENHATIAKRREQIQSVLSSPQSGTRTVGPDEADFIKDNLAELVSGVERDTRALLRLATKLDQARAALANHRNEVERARGALSGAE